MTEHEAPTSEHPSHEVDTKGEEGDTPKTWKSCCFVVDKEACKYILTYTLSASILAFSFAMAASADDTRLTIWVSIISGISGQYLPSPLFSPR
jgi:hypothetical protein